MDEIEKLLMTVIAEISVAGELTDRAWDARLEILRLVHNLRDDNKRKAAAVDYYRQRAINLRLCLVKLNQAGFQKIKENLT